jgi:hypothetical protein
MNIEDQDICVMQDLYNQISQQILKTSILPYPKHTSEIEELTRKIEEFIAVQEINFLLANNSTFHQTNGFDILNMILKFCKYNISLDEVH